MMMTIGEFGRRLRGREISAAEMTAECLRRIDAENGRLNTFITVMRKEAERQAAEADRELASGRDRGPLHGVPISVKDLVDIRGVPTTAASRVREGHIAAADAPAIARLRQAGAVLIGKTNLHEFAFGTTNEDSAYGAARNPVDPARSPGGSSGGSAASVAAGMALATLGTDTGGSIRIPAAACGIVGVKPTFGEVPTGGVVPLSGRLDHVGPLAASVADASFMLDALLGRRDAPPDSRPVSAMRFRVLRRYFCDLLDDDVRARFEEAVVAIAKAGGRIDDPNGATIAHADLIAPVYMHISFGDAAAYHAATLTAMPERYTPPVRLRLEMARTVLAEDYVRALAGQQCLTSEVEAALSGCDALLLPTLPIPAPPIGAASMTAGGAKHPVRSLTLRLTQLFNLTGHPAISLPCGATSDGLPVGLQIVGAKGRTDVLLQIARAIEALLA
jgi:aspartyl-tRNA(Asn)/glutamyl-tRNA(Gln) amidotransferase subunit A